MRACLICFIFLPSLLLGQSTAVFETRSLVHLKKNLRQFFSGPQLDILQIRFKGSKKSVGLFQGAAGLFQMDEGLVLSTGCVDRLRSTNNLDPTTGIFNKKKRAILKPYQSDKIRDAAILEISFIPKADFISFHLVMASTAYPAFVQTAYDDLILALLYSPNGQINNIATLPNSDEPICIQTINPRNHPELFIRNSNLVPYPISTEADTFWVEDLSRRYKIVQKKNIQLAKQNDFDQHFLCKGMTKILPVVYPVIKGKKHRLYLLVADQGNALYDTALFIEAGSFSSHPPKEDPTGILARNSQYYYWVDTLDVQFKDQPRGKGVVHKTGHVCVDRYPQVQFDYDSHSLTTIAKQQLDTVWTLLKKCTEMNLQIDAYAAAISDVQYNQKLSKARAEEVRLYMLNKGLAAYRIRMNWHGNNTASNPNIVFNKRIVQLKLKAF